MLRIDASQQADHKKQAVRRRRHNGAPQSVLSKLSNKLSTLTTTFALRRPDRDLHHLVSIRHVDVPLVVHRRLAGGDEAFLGPFPLSHKLAGGRELLDPIVAGVYDEDMTTLTNDWKRLFITEAPPLCADGKPSENPRHGGRTQALIVTPARPALSSRSRE